MIGWLNGKGPFVIMRYKTVFKEKKYEAAKQYSKPEQLEEVQNSIPLISSVSLAMGMPSGFKIIASCTGV